MTVEIILLRGEIALVDDEDARFAEYDRWRVQWDAPIGTPDRWPISVVRTRGGVTTLLHREILKAPPGMIVDHKNRDVLDNRRANLRICTHAENMRNTKLNARNKAGAKGVYFAADRNKYRALIRINKKKIDLGAFDTFEEAVLVRMQATEKLHKEFGRHR